MLARTLATQVQAYLDARSQLEQRRSEVNDVDPELRRLEQVRHDLQQVIDHAQDAAATALVAAVREHVEAEAAFEQCRSDGNVMEPAARRLERARRALQEELRTLVYEMAPIPRRPAGSWLEQQRILVAIDNGEPSEWAVQIAGQLAEQLCARLALVHVVRPVLGFGRNFMAANRLEATRRQEGAELLRRTQQSLSQAISSECMLRTGVPMEEITAAARDWKADLIVLGRRERGRFVRCLSASTSESVTRHAACPVVTVGQEPHREPSEDDDWIPMGADCAAPLAAHRCSETRRI